jgi:prepilin-type N-terminal cleavage/methylation domain-containing protein
MSYKILLVDDDITQSRVVEQIIRDKTHYHTKLVENGQDAINILTSKDANDIDIVLLDLSMPGIDGVGVLNAVRPVRPNLPIIVRTGYDDIDMAVEAMKAGATDFIKKFDSPERLKKSIDTALRTHALNDEISVIRKTINGGTSFEDIIGESPAIKEMINLGKRVSTSDIPVLLEGESGSGKESMARAIHYASKRSDKPFVAVNCGAIPQNLVESILFGHEKGAFTGAIYKTYGKFREADGGTIFLDEVGELPLDIQVKLLRVLQDGEIDPVGSTKPIKVDVRIISATNKNLNDSVKNASFREDLYYRLNVFPVYVPPLRDRNGDVSLLIKHFINSCAKSESKNISGISPEAEELLCKYRWPGNIRELKNTIFRATVLCDTNALSLSDFPQIVSAVKNDIGIGFGNGMSKLSQANGLIMQKDSNDFRKLCDIEKDIIASALKYYNGRMSEVARKLGIGRSTLYRKLEEFGIEHNDNSEAKPEAGFTLVELAIVLVVMGLLAVAAVSGRSLIRSAELKTVITNVQSYRIAVDNFKTQYEGLPGDLKNASNFWGLTACGGVAANCNGDGKIGTGAVTDDTEVYYAWYQLSIAQLIAGTYSGTGTFAIMNGATPNVPANKSLAGVGYSLTYLATPFSYVDDLSRSFPGNYFVVGKNHATDNYLSTAALNADDAMWLDSKVDDGTPDFGTVLGGTGNGASGTCISGSAPNATYNATNSNISCLVMFTLSRE